MPTDADVMHNRELYSSVASCSSGVELDQAQVVVVGNARGIGGRYRIGHSVMQDALDQDGIWAAIRDAGLDLPERAHWSDIDGRLVVGVLVASGVVSLLSLPVTACTTGPAKKREDGQGSDA